MERWRAVPGFEGYYEVSDAGRVRSVDRVIVSRRGDQRRMAGKVQQLRARGRYLTATLCRGGRKTIVRVHVLVLRAFVGRRPPGKEGCHGNGLSLDNRLSNLRWDTPLANHADKRAHGTILCGERHQNCTMTDGQVSEVRALPAGRRGTEDNIARWAREHGFSKGHVYNVRAGFRRGGAGG